MIWQPYTYQDGPRGLEHDKTCDHSIKSDCGRYRISRGKTGDRMRYHLWAIAENPPPGALYSSGSGRAHCIEVYDDPDTAKRAAAAHASGSPAPVEPGPPAPTQHHNHVSPGHHLQVGDG